MDPIERQWCTVESYNHDVTFLSERNKLADLA
jgi:hypothetical protein